MKYSKKISALIIALMMVFAMGTSVFAAQDTVGDAPIEVKTSANTISIPKTIIVTNPEEIKVYGPTIAYNFTVEPATVASGTKVTSDADRSAERDYATSTVKAGPAGGVAVTTQPSFTGAETAAVTGTKGVELTSNIVLTTDISKFTKPGIYRYELKDATTDATLKAAAVTRESNYSATRYFDVYIHNSADGLVIGGYTLLKSNEKTITGDNDTTYKSPGFISGSTTDGDGKVTAKGDQPADLYNTINASLEKEVTGGLGDKTNEFAFTINVSNSGKTYYTTGVATAGEQGTAGSDATISKGLAHGGKFFIKGLRADAKLTTTETNNTQDTYAVTIKDGASAVVNSIDKESTEPNATQTTGALAVSNYVDQSTQSIAASSNAAIKFINDLSEVSPTNVVLRFAPYLFILGGAVLLLAVSRRRKAEQE